MKQMRWVPVPNEHDGDGYSSLAEMENPVIIYGCWILITQVASKCHPRGTLVRKNGEPHDEQSLSRLTRMPQDNFAGSIKALLQIGWLEEVAPSCHEGARKAHCHATEGRKGREGKEVRLSQNTRIQKPESGEQISKAEPEPQAPRVSALSCDLFDQDLSEGLNGIKGAGAVAVAVAGMGRDRRAAKPRRARTVDGEVFAILGRPKSEEGFGLSRSDVARAGKMLKGVGGAWSAHKLAALDWALRGDPPPDDPIALARAHMRGKTGCKPEFEAMVARWAGWLKITELKIKAAAIGSEASEEPA